MRVYMAFWKYTSVPARDLHDRFPQYDGREQSDIVAKPHQKAPMYRPVNHMMSESEVARGSIQLLLSPLVGVGIGIGPPGELGFLAVKTSTPVSVTNMVCSAS